MIEGRGRGPRHTHVGGDKHPLRQSVCRELLVEECEVLGLGQTAGVGADGFEAD